MVNILNTLGAVCAAEVAQQLEHELFSVSFFQLFLF